MMDADGLERLRAFDAIYFGAVGDPSVPDDVAVWELILPIRKHFDQYVNLRPMRLLPASPCPLAGRTAADLDMVCVRENSRGEYSGSAAAPDKARPTRGGGDVGLHPPRHRARSRATPSPWRARGRAAPGQRHQVERAAPFDGAVGRGASRRWHASIPEVTWRKYHVDALAARMVTHPQTLDVIVGSNLFGDILTDLGAALTGSLGLAPGANLDPGAPPSLDVRAHPRVGARHRGQAASRTPSPPSGRER